METLTLSDYQDIKYFWTQKGDVTRWVGWSRKLPAIKEKHPELIHALDMMNFYTKIVDSVIAGLPED